MTQALQLNFLGNQERSSKIGWVLFIAGLILVGWQLLEYSQIVQVNSNLRDELQNTLSRLKINKDDIKRQPVTSPQERAAITQARVATGQLNYPWDSLLGLIETTQHPDVALLALDPKSRNGQIRLTAEAKNEAAMVAYVAGLQQNPLLQSAVLTTQQLQVQFPGSPLKFQILAQWKNALASTANTNPSDAVASKLADEKVLP